MSWCWCFVVTLITSKSYTWTCFTCFWRLFNCVNCCSHCEQLCLISSCIDFICFSKESFDFSLSSHTWHKYLTPLCSIHVCFLSILQYNHIEYIYVKCLHVLPTFVLSQRTSYMLDSHKDHKRIVCLHVLFSYDCFAKTCALTYIIFDET